MEAYMNIPVKGNVSWVGKIDWELQKFHGNEYSTNQGSTYNHEVTREVILRQKETRWRKSARGSGQRNKLFNLFLQ